MPEIVSQTASLIGQIIEDVTYEPMRPSQYRVLLVGVNRPPQYKEGGFFVFSDLRPGLYSMRIVGDGFQAQDFTVTIPLEPVILDSPPLFDSPALFDISSAFEAFPLFEQPGDNELVVIVDSVDSSGNVITFDSVIVRKEIRAGAFVFAQDFATRLATTLDVGRVTRAKLEKVARLTSDSLVRIVRGKSIRLKFNPYHPLPFVHTRIVGKVVRQEAPEIPLPGAQVRLINVNNAEVVLQEIARARIATVAVNATETILGTEKDVVTFTNDRGDYNLYFTGDSFAEVTLEVTLDRYVTAERSGVITLGQRNTINFQLVKS
jgi:hypothetical protein